MNKKVRITALLLISVMLVLAACGSGSNGGSGGSGNTGKGSEQNGNGSASGQDDKVEELVVAFPQISTTPEGLQLVEDAVNEISEQKIKVRVKFLPINAGEWAQRMNLIFSGGEDLDLSFVSGLMYSNMVAKGQLIALDELLEQHGEGIKAAFDPQYLDATKINGEIYSIPTLRDLAGSYGLTIRKDLADKHNIDVASITNLDDVERVLAAIKSAEPDVVPLVPGGVGHSFRDNYVFYDPLGDYMGVLPDYDNGLQVVNLYEMPEYEAFVHRIRDWYLNGYILSDAATNKTTTFELIGSGKAFSYMALQKPGFEAQESKATGTEMVTAELVPAVATTSNVTNAMWGIPVNSKNPEKAMKFLNLMYADEQILNLFHWGVEGVHYVKAEGQDRVITYPEGKDAGSIGYNMLGWMFGNSFLAFTMEGNDPDIWQKTEEFNNSSKRSKALGFVFDASEVRTEVAAVSNVVTQYKLPLETGSVDPVKMLPDFISKLKAAGIDKVIEEKQRQLDEWAKANAVQ